MNNRTVEYELDLGNPPPLTKDQKAELKALKVAQSSNEEINYSDIPALGDDFWKAAARKPLLQAQKGLYDRAGGCGRALVAQIQWKGLPDQNQRYFARGHVEGCVETVKLSPRARAV